MAMRSIINTLMLMCMKPLAYRKDTCVPNNAFPMWSKSFLKIWNAIDMSRITGKII